MVVAMLAALLAFSVNADLAVGATTDGGTWSVDGSTYTLVTAREHDHAGLNAYVLGTTDKAVSISADIVAGGSSADEWHREYGFFFAFTDENGDNTHREGDDNIYYVAVWTNGEGTETRVGIADMTKGWNGWKGETVLTGVKKGDKITLSATYDGNGGFLVKAADVTITFFFGGVRNIKGGAYGLAGKVVDGNKFENVTVDTNPKTLPKHTYSYTATKDSDIKGTILNDKIKADTLVATGMNFWGDGAAANLFKGPAFGKVDLEDGAEGKVKLGGNTLNTPTFTFETTEKVKVGSYAIVSGFDSGKWPVRDPKAWNVYGSTDGENWTKIDEVKDSTIPSENSVGFVYEVDKVDEYDHFKFEFTGYYGGDLQLDSFVLVEASATPVTPPKTGDVAIIVISAVALVSLAAAALVATKRKIAE